MAWGRGPSQRRENWGGRARGPSPGARAPTGGARGGARGGAGSRGWARARALVWQAGDAELLGALMGLLGAASLVGYWLKERRFCRLRRGAARYPAGCFRYIGIEVLEAMAHSTPTEEAATAWAWKRDLYGCGGELECKRLRRDPFAPGGHYAGSCPELRGLLEHFGAGQCDGALPWDFSWA